MPRHAKHSVRIFSTRVEVNRIAAAIRSVSAYLLHTRGGEPYSADSLRVSNVRKSAYLLHTRGGEPDPTVYHSSSRKSSPHAWRGTEYKAEIARLRVIFSTRVEVNRLSRTLSMLTQNLLHTRGGEPSQHVPSSAARASSPHAWR